MSGQRHPREPVPVGPIDLNTARRFWSRCVREGSCLRRGRGDSPPIIMVEGRRILGRRLAYALHYGEPGGHQVSTTCGHAWCVEPLHLSPDRPPSGVGEGHYNSRLDWPRVRKIRRLAEAGLGPSEIARRIGTTKQTVCDIVKRRRWKGSSRRRADLGGY